MPAPQRSRLAAGGHQTRVYPRPTPRRPRQPPRALLSAHMVLVRASGAETLDSAALDHSQPPPLPGRQGWLDSSLPPGGSLHPWCKAGHSGRPTRPQPVPAAAWGAGRPLHEATHPPFDARAPATTGALRQGRRGSGVTQAGDGHRSGEGTLCSGPAGTDWPTPSGWVAWRGGCSARARPRGRRTWGT